MFVMTNPAALSKAELEAELAAQAAHVDAGLSRLVELAAECERRLDWAGEGTTFAAWLAWRCSLTPRQAREHERIGRALAELPLAREAFARGEISYAKVAALTRVADAENESKLLELAEVLTASQLERAIAAYRRFRREEAVEQQEREFVTWFWTDDGSLAFRGQLPAEDGALLVRSLEAARAALSQKGEERVSNAEAFVAMADTALAKAGRDRTGGERTQVVIHVDAATLAHDADGRCELADGIALAPETARRLSCDASVVDLGRKRRTVSSSQRRALQARDRGCRFPGCDRTRFVDAHHVQHWSQGGETNLDNLVTLCRRHHRFVHERGYSVKLGDDGEVAWRNQHGLVLPNVPRPPPSDAGALRDLHDCGTCKNGTGDRMDVALAAAAIDAAVS